MFSCIITFRTRVAALWLNIVGIAINGKSLKKNKSTQVKFNERERKIALKFSHLVQELIQPSRKSYDTSLKYISHLYNLRKISSLNANKKRFVMSKTRVKEFKQMSQT